MNRAACCAGQIQASVRRAARFGSAKWPRSAPGIIGTKRPDAVTRHIELYASTESAAVVRFYQRGFAFKSTSKLGQRPAGVFSDVITAGHQHPIARWYPSMNNDGFIQAAVQFQPQLVISEESSGGGHRWALYNDHR
jgi:hypothetical protein